MAKPNVLVLTGGTGSFGTNFLRILLNKTDFIIRVFSRDEHKQEALREKYGDSRLRYLLGDIRDKDRVSRAFEGADYVVHAAAYKQVPVAEINPLEAIKTNVYGSQNVVEAALDCLVKKCVLISTDKAAYPINLYGATKKCAEQLFIRANDYRGDKPCRFVATRYGNVVGSRGTIVPIFHRLASEGKSIPLTSNLATRFWLSLDEANEFVLKSLLRESQGGEVYIPKIPSVRIVDVIKAIAPNSHVHEIGRRSGDKLHETLVTDEEMTHCYSEDSGYVIEPENPSWPYFKVNTNGLHISAYTSDSNPHWKDVRRIEKDYKDWLEINDANKRTYSGHTSV